MKLGGSRALPYLLLALGMGIGVVVASDLGLMPRGAAGPETPANGVVRPISTVPQQPVTGGTAKSFVDIAKTEARRRQHCGQPLGQVWRRPAKFPVRRSLFSKVLWG